MKIKKYPLPEAEIRKTLQIMYEDDSYLTTSGYSIDSKTYPNNKVPFVESHIKYLKSHPQVDPQHYIGNLRIMLKVGYFSKN
jgi:hypothetical protein